ncbi:Hypothetical predicted protein [Pelobates cultripes]|uniref:Uncharacterized protein n=1 Tax=Pelobates cultripes TaxID=61616 RepID=A0AAD1WCU3_PELCU|nr:Hypothetical predicted protein [Pelobates cultripes]
MSQNKSKETSTKGDKQNFFGQKTTTTLEPDKTGLHEGEVSAEGDDHAAGLQTMQCSDALTKAFFKNAMDAMSTKLITTWQITAKIKWPTSPPERPG